MIITSRAPWQLGPFVLPPPLLLLLRFVLSAIGLVDYLSNEAAAFCCWCGASVLRCQPSVTELCIGRFVSLFFFVPALLESSALFDSSRPGYFHGDSQPVVEFNAVVVLL